MGTPKQFYQTVLTNVLNLLKEEKSHLDRVENPEIGVSRKKHNFINSMIKSLEDNLNEKKSKPVMKFIGNQKFAESLLGLGFRKHECALFEYVIMKNEPVTMIDFYKSYKITRTDAYHVANRLLDKKIIGSEGYIGEGISTRVKKHYFLLDKPEVALAEYFKRFTELKKMEFNTSLKILKELLNENEMH